MRCLDEFSDEQEMTQFKLDIIKKLHIFGKLRDAYQDCAILMSLLMQKPGTLAFAERQLTM